MQAVSFALRNWNIPTLITFIILSDMIWSYLSKHKGVTMNHNLIAIDE